MSSLETRLSDLITAIGADFKTLRRLTAPSLKRTGAIAESCDRRYLTDATGAFSVATGQTRWVAIALEADDVISNITISVGATGAGTPTHHYAMIASRTSINTVTVQRRSADRTTTAIPANGEISYTLSSAYTVPTSGIYYIGWNVTATTTPTCVNFAAQWPIISDPMGAALTSGNSTPPAEGTVLTINTNQRVMYCWVS